MNSDNTQATERIKDMVADMNLVADFLQEKGRFVGAEVHVPIKHLADRISELEKKNAQLSELILETKFSDGQPTPILYQMFIENEEQRTRISDLEKAQEWQDISTAPRDGTRVGLWSKEHDTQYVGYYKPEDEMWFIAREVFVRPTHWQPLQKPPRIVPDEVW